MAIYSQIGSFPVQGGDLSMKNYTVTDIAAGVAVIMDTTTGNILGVTPPATSGPVTGSIGITMEKIYAGKTGRVRYIGSAIATSHDTIAVGAAVQIDTAAGFEGCVKTCGAATTQLGRALTAAVTGDPVLVAIVVATNA